MDSFDKKKQGSGGSRPSDKGGRGGRGAGHPDAEIRGGARSQKQIFSALWASVWSKNKGGSPAPRVPPLDSPLQGTNKRE